MVPGAFTLLFSVALRWTRLAPSRVRCSNRSNLNFCVVSGAFTFLLGFLTLHIFCSIKCLSISLLFLTNRNHLPMFLSYFPNFTFFTLQFIFLFRYGWFGSHHRRDITMPHNLSHTLAAHNTYCCVSVL